MGPAATDDSWAAWLVVVRDNVLMIMMFRKFCAHWCKNEDGDVESVERKMEV